MCNSVKSIKYICKYIHKCSNMAIVELEETDKCDDIQIYQMAKLEDNDFGVANDGLATRINAGSGGSSAPDVTLVHNIWLDRV